LSLSDSNADMEASESSDGFSTWQHTLSPDIYDPDSRLSSSISNSGSIVSHQSATSAPFSAPQHILSSESSDSDSVLAFSTSGSVLKVPESPVKLESLVDSLSRLGSNLSLKLLF